MSYLSLTRQQEVWKYDSGIKKHTGFMQRILHGLQRYNGEQKLYILVVM